MKTNVSRDDFKQTMLRVRPGNFSNLGLEMLYDYFIEFEESCDMEITFDPIGICCEFSEYESLEEFHKSYDKGEYPDLETLRDRTSVIEFTKHGSEEESFIIGDF